MSSPLYKTTTTFLLGKHILILEEVTAMHTGKHASNSFQNRDTEQQACPPGSASAWTKPGRSRLFPQVPGGWAGSGAASQTRVKWQLLCNPPALHFTKEKKKSRTQAQDWKKPQTKRPPTGIGFVVDKKLNGRLSEGDTHAPPPPQQPAEHLRSPREVPAVGPEKRSPVTGGLAEGSRRDPSAEQRKAPLLSGLGGRPVKRGFPALPAAAAMRGRAGPAPRRAGETTPRMR